MMPLQMPPEPNDTVRKISIKIGDEEFSADWGKPIPHNEAMRRLRVMLSTFDREAQEPSNER
jgi:hypothetical protein